MGLRRVLVVYQFMYDSTPEWADSSFVIMWSRGETMASIPATYGVYDTSTCKPTSVGRPDARINHTLPDGYLQDNATIQG